MTRAHDNLPLARRLLSSGLWRIWLGLAMGALLGVAGGPRAEGGEFIRVRVGVDGEGRAIYEQVYQAGPRDRFARSSTQRGRAVRRIDRGASLVVGYEGPEIYWMPWGGCGGPIVHGGPVGWAGGRVGQRAWVPGGLLPCGSGARFGAGVAGSWMSIYWTR